MARFNGATHRIKTWPEYFEAVAAGRKTFEVRKNDRNYKVDDCVVLREWCPNSNRYTGREWVGWISYMTTFAQREGWVVFGVASVAVPYQFNKTPKG